MPLSVASTTTASPPRNVAVRQADHGRAGCRRATRSTPHRYSPATTTTTPVTTGANCQTATTACQPNGRSMEPPPVASLLTSRDPGRPAHLRGPWVRLLPPRNGRRPAVAAIVSAGRVRLVADGGSLETY